MSESKRVEARAIETASWGAPGPARTKLRESRGDRRRRKARLAMLRADRLLHGGTPRLASVWAHWARRLDPECPQSLLVLGLTCVNRCRHARALLHFQVAYLLAIERSPYRVGEEIVPQVAVEAARCCGRLMTVASTAHDREAWAEQILDWARIAARDDPAAPAIMADDPLLLDVRDQIQLLDAPVASWIVEA